MEPETRGEHEQTQHHNGTARQSNGQNPDAGYIYDALKMGVALMRAVLNRRRIPAGDVINTYEHLLAAREMLENTRIERSVDWKGCMVDLSLYEACCCLAFAIGIAAGQEEYFLEEGGRKKACAEYLDSLHKSFTRAYRCLTEYSPPYNKFQALARWVERLESRFGLPLSRPSISRMRMNIAMTEEEVNQLLKEEMQSNTSRSVPSMLSEGRDT